MQAGVEGVGKQLRFHQPGREQAYQRARERRERRVLCSEAVRERQRGGPGGSEGRDDEGEGEVGGESRGGTAVAADRGMAVAVEGAARLRGQKAEWQVKERVVGGRMWCVGGGRENNGDGGDRRDAAARVQKAVEDSKGAGTGGEMTARAERGVAMGQRAWGRGWWRRGWEREERVAARALRERVEADSACGGRQWGVGGRQRGGSDRR